MSKRQQITIQDFIESYEKHGAGCLIYDVEKYNEPKNNGNKKKKTKATITWLPYKFLTVGGKVVYPKWKFTEIIIGGGAKYHQGSDDDKEEKKIPTNVTVTFCAMEPEDIAGPGFEVRQIAITSDQRKSVLKMAKKISKTKKKSGELAKAKKQMREMFPYRSNYRLIHEQLADDDLCLDTFTEWIDERIVDMNEKQAEENETHKLKIEEYSANTKLFARFAECYHLAFTANAKELVTRQDECDFTIAKGKQDPPSVCGFKQSTRTIGDGKNKKVENLPKPLYRFKIPVNSKTGEVGKMNYRENTLEPVIFDSSKSTSKNKFRKVPAKVENDKGKMCKLTYKNVGQFVTFKSVTSGFITAKDMATHMFGISAGNELTNMVIRSNQSKSKDGGFDEEEMKKLAGNGSDDSSSDEDQDLPDDETDDEDEKASDDDAEDPKFEVVPVRKAVVASSEEEEPEQRKPKAKSKKSKKASKQANSSEEENDDDDEDDAGSDSD